MELVLTEADLQRMPAELRHQLFLYLGRTMGPDEGDKAEGGPLTREHAIAVLREVSFHRAGGCLRLLLERLSYADAARPPTRKRLTAALGENGAHLGQYVAALNRIAAKVAGHPGLKLCQYHQAGDAYTAHAATRGVLRDLLAAMKASGKNEEPPWG
jgi:hypothetical protein